MTAFLGKVGGSSTFLVTHNRYIREILASLVW